MSTRYRWYRIRVPPNQDLGRLLARRPLTEASRVGFYKQGDTPSEASFRFVWRTTVVATRYDRDGVASHEEFQSIDVLNFALINIGRTSLLRVENPHRNLREFMNALESLAGFGFSCAPVLFENVRPTLVFDHVDASKLVSLKVVGAAIGEDLVARIELASKMGMKMGKIKMLEGLHYKVDVAVFECILQGVKGQISVSSNGTVRLSGPLSPRLLHFVERELPQIARSGG